MKIENCIERTYCLYASEWHLTVMLLPFISKKLYEKNRIYMKFENSIEDKMNKLTERLKIKNKDEIKDIKWNLELNDEDYSMNEKMYIVAGSDQYIEEMNQSIIEYYKNKDCKVKIINCFDICADKEKHNLIIDKNYVSTLTTRGESAIS